MTKKKTVGGLLLSGKRHKAFYDKLFVLHKTMEYVNNMDLLIQSDITLVRSTCEDHSQVCPGCGICLGCTIPHWCCCGKCGSKCNHDHEAYAGTPCYHMDRIHHERFPDDIEIQNERK